MPRRSPEIDAFSSGAIRGAPESGCPPPPLKWAGGKRWQIPHVIEWWLQTKDARLVEPFCGGLAVALGLRPARAVLNDINPHLINFYRWLRKGLVIGIPMNGTEACYYSHRQTFNDLLASGTSDTAEAAALFYYLNRTGYNGLCRFNASGRFNVPFGRYAKINYRRSFPEYAPLLSNWEFTNADFVDVALDGDDFVYADPPYDVDFTQYAKDGFGWEEQVRTATWLSRHSGPVILSNQATRRIVSLYQDLGYELTFLDGPRRISCTGDRTPAPEVLAVRNLTTKPPAPAPIAAGRGTTRARPRRSPPSTPRIPRSSR
jgi:DNA adenine methylase